MPPRPNSDRAGDPLDPDSIPRKEFRSTFRGYDQLEVKAYLTSVAVELQAVLERERVESMRASHAEKEVLAIESMDDDQITELLGERTGQILASARQTAADIEAEAIRRAQSIRSVAEEDSERMRAEAEMTLGDQLEDNSRAEAKRRQDAESVAEHAREQYHEELEEARREARLMVEEAKRVRDQIIKDLARQRRVAQRQYAALVALRDDLDGRMAAVTAGVSHGRAALEGLFDLETTLELEAEIETGSVGSDEVEISAGPEFFDIDVLEANEARAIEAAADEGEAIDLTDGADVGPSGAEFGGTDPIADSAAERGAEPSLVGGESLMASGVDVDAGGAGHGDVVDINVGADQAGDVDPKPSGPTGQAVEGAVAAGPSMAAVGAPAIDESVDLGVAAPTGSEPPAEAKVFSLDEARDASRRVDRGVPMDHPALGAPDGVEGENGSNRTSEPTTGEAEAEAEAEVAQNGQAKPKPGHDVSDAEAKTEPASGDAAPESEAGGSVAASDGSETDAVDGSTSGDAEPVVDGERACEATAESQEGDSAPGGVSDEVGQLFARIRAGGEGDADPHTGEPIATWTESGDPGVAALTGAGPKAARVVDGTELAALRGADVVGLDRKLTRRLKRQLSDDQNTLLDRLRRHHAGANDGGALPSFDDHLTEYRSTQLVEVVRAAELGMASIDPEAEMTEALIAELSDGLIRSLVEPLHQGLKTAVDSAGELEEEIVARVRTCYRETKLQRVRSLAGDAIIGAYARGAAAAIEPTTSIVWIQTGPDGCGESCRADEKSGSVPLGEAFPSGNFWPPAQPGCDCLVVPERG